MLPIQARSEHSRSCLKAGVAAGVRRIEALTSKGLMDYYGELEQLLHEAAKLLKATPADCI